jgi:hypothetical protein
MAKDNTGPRGGTTTVTKSGMVRKTMWFNQDEAEALRVRAFEERKPESEIVREALRRFLGIPD